MKKSEAGRLYDRFQNEKTFSEFFCQIRKNAQGTFQDSVDAGDAQPVISHGHILVCGAAVTVLHLPLVQHAAAAVDD